MAGRFSLCGLLLRLRNLYKWEHGLAPWQEPDPAPVLEWVSQREELWLEVHGQEPRPLELEGQVFDPFDAQGINALLEPRGYIYGAGRAGGLLPAFFLGRLEASRQEQGLTIRRVGQELGRDIYFLPGLRQGETIYLRREPLAFLLWDKLSDPRPSQARFVEFGLAGYGLDLAAVLAQPSWDILAPVLEGELEAVAWHELGEAGPGQRAGGLLGWALANHPGDEVEHFVRGLKDLMADTGPGGRLERIMAARAQGPLGFYPAWLAGFPRLIFPEIDQAVQAVMDGQGWQALEQARLLGWQRAQEAMERLWALAEGEASQEGGPDEGLAARIRREVIDPLVGCRLRRPPQETA